MKKILLLSLFSVMLSAAHAQRLHPENLTDRTLLPSVVGPHRVGTRTGAPLVNTGSPKVPVVLVQFPDLPFTVAETEAEVHQLYDEFFNAPEGAHPATSYCSVKEYFRRQSGGQFEPEFDIIGPITLPQSYTYYGEDQGSRKDVHIGEFFSDACQLAVQHDVNWADYDNDKDKNGVVDMVFFIYAGEGQNATGDITSTIWPKESATSQPVTYQGKTITFGSYGCTNELYMGEIDGIGTCIHELCHGLGLPDFYDPSYLAYGLDYWDVMDSGCYQMDGCCPCHMSAYELDFMGWRELVTLEIDAPCSLTLQPLSKGGVGYKLVNAANPNEYFILENRQNASFDNYLGCPDRTYFQKYGAAHGLMITHVDYSAQAWASNSVNTNKSHQRITIVPADGETISYQEQGGDPWAQSMLGDLYPGSHQVSEMSSYKVFTGGTLGQTITNIVEHADGTITLDINGGQPEDPDEGLVEPDEPEIA